MIDFLVQFLYGTVICCAIGLAIFFTCFILFLFVGVAKHLLELK